MNKALAFFALAALVSFASATAVQKCASGPSPISVDIKNCDKEPCKLPDGQDAVMDIKFKVPKYSATLKPKIRATVAGVTVVYPLPGDKQDGCKALQGSFCPVDVGEEITYRLEMPISGFPLVSVVVEFSVLGANDEVFQCFRVQCQVVAGTLKVIN